MSKFSDAVQAVFTKGLDVAQTVAIAKLQVNDPTGYVTGPNGTRVPTGQSSLVSGLNIPPIAWIALVAVIGAVVVLPLLRK